MAEAVFGFVIDDAPAPESFGVLIAGGFLCEGSPTGGGFFVARAGWGVVEFLDGVFLAIDVKIEAIEKVVHMAEGTLGSANFGAVGGITTEVGEFSGQTDLRHERAILPKAPAEDICVIAEGVGAPEDQHFAVCAAFVAEIDEIGRASCRERV